MRKTCPLKSSYVASVILLQERDEGKSSTLQNQSIRHRRECKKENQQVPCMKLFAAILRYIWDSCL